MFTKLAFDNFSTTTPLLNAIMYGIKLIVVSHVFVDLIKSEFFDVSTA